MNADIDNLNKVTETMIGCAYRVSDNLGCGFLEKIYENALAHELRKAGLKVEQQKRFSVIYDGSVVGEYIADLIVEDEMIVETKAVRVIEEIHKDPMPELSQDNGLKAWFNTQFWDDARGGKAGRKPFLTMESSAFIINMNPRLSAFQK